MNKINEYNNSLNEIFEKYEQNVHASQNIHSYMKNRRKNINKAKQMVFKEETFRTKSQLAYIQKQRGILN